jgi:hypothetical protein
MAQVGQVAGGRGLSGGKFCRARLRQEERLRL